jgi:hypothetical protein
MDGWPIPAGREVEASAQAGQLSSSGHGLGRGPIRGQYSDRTFRQDLERRPDLVGGLEGQGPLKPGLVPPAA